MADIRPWYSAVFPDYYRHLRPRLLAGSIAVAPDATHEPRAARRLAFPVPRILTVFRGSQFLDTSALALLPIARIEPPGSVYNESLNDSVQGVLHCKKVAGQLVDAGQIRCQESSSEQNGSVLQEGTATFALGAAANLRGADDHVARRDV